MKAKKIIWKEGELEGKEGKKYPVETGWVGPYHVFYLGHAYSGDEKLDSVVLWTPDKVPLCSINKEYKNNKDGKLGAQSVWQYLTDVITGQEEDA